MGLELVMHEEGYMEKSKTEFARKSLEKSSDFKGDPFIRFIILWIGLNALYSQIGWEENGKNYGQEVVKNYFERRLETVYSLILRNRSELKELYAFISTTKQHKRLSSYLQTRKDFLKGKPHSKERAVETFAEFLYKIRNNMFHAVKQWNEKNEADLLAKVNPILEDLLRGLIKA